MDRRTFIRSACQACAALAVVPAVATLEGCASGKGTSYSVNDGALAIPLAGLTPGVNIIRAKGLDHTLLLDKRSDGTIVALALNCPHKNGPVKFKDGEGLKCEWHGSTFDGDGKVTKGPSKQDLKRYPTTVEGDMLRVNVG
ncbi:MAG: Rieske (2Fe-2S) protein [Flavobacteriales bacterium]|nr:Rieske (2Fe-2S) protein [Flavobacteriales bacterium]